MSELRNKMKMDLEIRGYSPTTTKYYLRNVSNFAKYFNKSPELLGEDEIRKYLHYCSTEKHLSEGTINTIHSALKFVYTKTLGRAWNTDNTPRMKEGRKLPVVLSKTEVKSILDITKNLKHKAILMTIYAAGLRVSEGAKLKINDIDSKNKQIIVRQGKGKKDRYVMLSDNNLKILRLYWKKYQPETFLFPGKDPTRPISSRTIEKVIVASAKKAGIKKNVTVHTMRHYVECFIMVSVTPQDQLLNNLV